MKKSELKELIMECMIEVMNDNYYNTYNDNEYYDEDAKSAAKKAAIGATILTSMLGGGMTSRASAVDTNKNDSSYSMTADDTQSDVEFEISKGVLVHAEFVGSASGPITINVPKGVKKIADEAFSNGNLGAVKEITLPDGLEEIGNNAFTGCEALTTINIPKSVKTIGDNAFANTNLKSITIPNSVESIGKQAFGGCENLGSVTFGSGLSSIGTEAFYNCTSLKFVVLPRNEASVRVVSIGGGAFKGCESLSSVKILSLKVAIGDKAFSGCESLKEFEFGSYTKLSKVSNIAFGKSEDCSITKLTLPKNPTKRVMRAPLKNVDVDESVLNLASVPSERTYNNLSLEERVAKMTEDKERENETKIPDKSARLAYALYNKQRQRAASHRINGK